MTLKIKHMVPFIALCTWGISSASAETSNAYYHDIAGGYLKTIQGTITQPAASTSEPSGVSGH